MGLQTTNTSKAITREVCNASSKSSEANMYVVAVVYMSTWVSKGTNSSVCSSKMGLTTLFWLAAYSLNSMLLTMVALLTCMAIFNQTNDTVGFQMLASIGVVVFNNIFVFGVWWLMRWCRPKKVINQSDEEKKKNGKEKQRKGCPFNDL
ncbi:hypothetical protein AQUCO_03700236v1 [Aquilegia coerulea]|uniref:Uncharacterized protein n=1 Tax=Aquilegia coerulea TaxID=218851 RepID=A0A2G5CU61_AQUCA|nr:hypothetical protein AQUCO_03700236v1 [Aquilegia coerulea]